MLNFVVAKNMRGTSYTISIGRNEQKNSRKSVLEYIKNSKMIKSTMEKPAETSDIAKRDAFSRVVRLHQVFSNNRFRQPENDKRLKLGKHSQRMDIRSSSVKGEISNITTTNRNKMNMTSYVTWFKTSKDKSTSRSAMGGAHRSNDYENMKMRNAKNTVSLFYPKDSLIVPSKSSKFKYGPDKVRPFLDYNFLQYQKPVAENLADDAPPPQSADPKGKAPVKAKEEVQQPKEFKFNISKNILFENVNDVDSDDEIGEPKFKKNDIKQEEIESKMFENPVPKRK